MAGNGDGMNIVLCNGKGGTGKTTMAVLLATALAEAGKRVAVLDLDPQATATNWLGERDGGKVEKWKSGTGYDVVLVDTAPRLDTLAPALARCSMAVLVASPSPADLWTTRDTAAAIRSKLPKGSRLRLLFNGVQALTSTISRRQCYQHAALLGWQALDPAAREELFKAALELVTA